MLRKKLTVLGSGCFLAMSVHSAMALANTDRGPLVLNASATSSVATKGRYIVQMKGNPAVTQNEQQTIPERRGGVLNNVKYDPNTSAAVAYRQELLNKQNEVIASVGISSVSHQYEHAFNGFAAALTEAQVAKLKSDPNVAYVWPDELMQMDTANTPSFLGITDPGVGLHDLGTKGEDIIIGIVDSGIWPENPSLDDTGFGPIADTRPDWSGTCDAGTDPEFACNNKLIGARYYNASFTVNGTILPGEFDSPRDADGHGTHVATTAGGNEDVPASIFGAPVGTVTGMAPRARISAYKVCWNGSTPGNSGCSTGDTVAAIDDAVADGVDVINMSISGSRTDTVDPVHAAFFAASQAGVYSAISAGNSGPTAQTVAHNIPWATTVAASTYDGTSALIGIAMNVSVNGEPQDSVLAIPGGIAAPIPEEGLSGALALVNAEESSTTYTACAPLTNPEEIAGNIALIARGDCPFSDKILNAQNAGATGVVVYSTDNSPFAMGGDGTGITTPGAMIANSDGLALVANLLAEDSVNVEFTDTAQAAEATEVGNIMANFSSKGSPLASSDLIKPDITAPGVRILAGASGSAIDTGVVGESYQYLQGTSMSSPHIAGLAALVREAKPGWTPAQVKSALMTTARQNVVKEDESAPADPFDFGAGHVDPNKATDPGLVYSAGDLDYFAFLCGLGENIFVETNLLDGDLGANACPALEANNWPTDASDLNLPSIAIGELAVPQTITRFVDNVAGSDSTYIATIEAPAGVEVELQVYDGESFNVTDEMFVGADSFAIYQLTFSKTESSVLDEWVFGSITWDDGTHVVRSPIAVRPTIPPRVIAPGAVQLAVEGDSARTSLSVDVAYNGRFFTQAMGLDTSIQQFDVVSQDPDSTFAFNEPGLGLYFLPDIPDSVRVVKFATRDADLSATGIDVDLYIYRCVPGEGCSEVATSTTATSNEDVTLVDPAPGVFGDDGVFYIAFVHGWSLNGLESIDVPVRTWIVDDSAPQNMVVRASSRASEGRTTRVSIGMGDLQPNTEYLGAIAYSDEEGNDNGLTVIEVNTEEQSPE